MNLKSTLKNIKLNESLISMFLGLFVIILVGFLVFNYFRNIGGGEISSTGEEDISLPATHIVEEGEDLWSISEKYYETGYNWTDIAEENSINDPNVVVAGQEIEIPDVTPKIIGEDQSIVAEADSPTPTLSPTSIQTIAPKIVKDADDIGIIENKIVENSQPIIGDSYTVVRGDNLWDISVRAYGDGYRWIDIAEANDLVNPSLIHSGNVFTIPR